MVHPVPDMTINDDRRSIWIQISVPQGSTTPAGKPANGRSTGIASKGLSLVSLVCQIEYGLANHLAFAFGCFGIAVKHLVDLAEQQLVPFLLQRFWAAHGYLATHQEALTCSAKGSAIL